MFKVVRTIKECILALIEWNRKMKGNAKVKIQELKEKLKIAIEKCDPCNNGVIASLKR